MVMPLPPLDEGTRFPSFRSEHPHNILVYALPIDLLVNEAILIFFPLPLSSTAAQHTTASFHLTLSLTACSLLLLLLLQ